jgi:hypothetical protein
MPEGFEDYIPMVSYMTRAANVSEPVFVTIDEKNVQPGMSQRRPGPHVDGCFMPENGYWGHGGGGGWNHGCNAIPIPRMPVIVASTTEGCRAWDGVFDGEPRNNGDLSHIADQLMWSEVLPANQAFLLSPDCVHESMIFDEPTQRQFIRLALPVNTPI